MDCLTYLKHHLIAKADFGFGFLLFGSLGQVFKVFGLFFLFVVGLRLLQIGWYCNGVSKILCDFGGESGVLRKEFCSKSDLDVKYRSKIASCKCKLLKFSKQLSKPLIANIDETEDNITFVKDDDENIDCKFNDGNDVEEEEEQESYEEDEEFDVLALRKMIKTERRRANNALLELEKERMAAATAAEEVMAMILRLQNEKSLVEMEANQYKRLAEEKQNHDQEVIESLQWLLSKHKSERSVLEDQLRLCGQKLKLSIQSDEGDHSEKADDAFNPGQIGYLDVNIFE